MMSYSQSVADSSLVLSFGSLVIDLLKYEDREGSKDRQPLKTSNKAYYLYGGVTKHMCHTQI